MKKFVLFISNSHIAAISRSIREGLVFVDFPIQRLAFIEPEAVASLKCEEGFLSSDSDATAEAIRRITKGDSKLNLQQFSQIIVYGCDLACRGGGANWILKLEQSAKGYSAAARHASYVDSIRLSQHYRFLCRIQDDDIRRKILSVPSPFPSEVHPWRQRIKTLNLQRIKQFVQMIGQEINALSVRYMPIPIELLTPGATEQCRSSGKKAGDCF
ncbi:MAG: hypothetical protein JXR76_02920 [Deltaproteobacteria bacterium]|nr:hypothetical protein [Deltaproteobacteria bacterium]